VPIAPPLQNADNTPLLSDTYAPAIKFDAKALKVVSKREKAIRWVLLRAPNALTIGVIAPPSMRVYVLSFD
jgi:hypothetical protein